jgi:hypothetical protein
VSTPAPPDGSAWHGVQPVYPWRIIHGYACAGDETRSRSSETAAARAHPMARGAVIDGIGGLASGML